MINNLGDYLIFDDMELEIREVIITKLSLQLNVSVQDWWLLL